jgi:hypothetical protein
MARRGSGAITTSVRLKSLRSILTRHSVIKAIRFTVYIIAGPGVHSYAANVLCNAVHHIAGAMCFKETHIELLVMIVYLILQIIFNIAAHYDQGLSHEKHKNPSQ